jgi:ubiquinone/menaquinone biosynthesis C-methylase UbiE
MPFLSVQSLSTGIPIDMAPTSAYDTAAPTFERHRGLPAGVAAAIRAAILDAIGTPSPRLLDLGAGTGRVGRPFVEAGDDYVGADLSFGMLRAFMQRGRARLVQADGERLPFADATFDAVMLIQIFGGMRGWRRLLAPGGSPGRRPHGCPCRRR